MIIGKGEELHFVDDADALVSQAFAEEVERLLGIRGETFALARESRE